MKWLNSRVVDPWLGIPQAVPRQGIERGISSKASRTAIVLYNASSEETRRCSDATADDCIGQSVIRDLG